MSDAPKHYLADRRPTVTVDAGAGLIQVGDVFTISAPPRLPWWGRLAVWLRLRSPPEPVIREFRTAAVVNGDAWVASPLSDYVEKCREVAHRIPIPDAFPATFPKR